MSRPPTTGPAAVPITPAVIQRAIPRRSSVAATSSSRQPTRANAPPSACTQRAAMSTSIEPASAHAAEAAANTAMPAAHSGAGLRRIVTHAAGTTTTASTRLNAISTHATCATVPSRRRRISGSASVTIAESASTNPTVSASSGTATRRTDHNLRGGRAVSRTARARGRGRTFVLFVASALHSCNPDVIHCSHLTQTSHVWWIGTVHARQADGKPGRDLPRPLTRPIRPR